MTSPRDALRALVQKWRAARKRFAVPGQPLPVIAGAQAIGDCADELDAILQQMDSEPTVAQWREAFKEWRFGGVGFTGLEAFDWIEQRARQLVAKDKQP